MNPYNAPPDNEVSLQQESPITIFFWPGYFVIPLLVHYGIKLVISVYSMAGDSGSPLPLFFAFMMAIVFVKRKWAWWTHQIFLILSAVATTLLVAFDFIQWPTSLVQQMPILITVISFVCLLFVYKNYSRHA